MTSECKSGTNYEFGCLMLYVDFLDWNIHSDKISENDLYRCECARYGIEKDPHITILYGIDKSVNDSDVVDLFSNFKSEDFDIHIKGIDCFCNAEYDVLKMNVISEKLGELNRLARSLKHTNEFPNYRPHLTIAYLKNNKGLKYLNKEFETSIHSITKIVYSKTNGEKINIPLK